MDRLTKLEQMNADAELAGGIDKIEKQHAKGKLTARERIVKLLDDDRAVPMVVKFVKSWIWL